MLQYRIFFNSNSFETSKYEVLYLLLGYHFNDIDQLKFKKISCVLSDFEVWVRQYGFKEIKSVEEANEIFISYQRPDDIEYVINNHLSFSIRFNANYPIGEFRSTATIKQTTGVNIRNIEGSESLENLLSYFYTFYRLMTLAYFKEPLIIDLSVVPESEEKYLPSISIHFKTETTKDNYKPITSQRLFLFGFRTIKNDFGDILNKWFELSKLLEPSFAGLAESFSQKNYAIELRFLNLAQAIESLHRRTDKILYKTSDFKEKLKTILDSVPLDYKSWLKEKLTYSFEPTLSERLLSLSDRIPLKVKHALFKPSLEKFLLNIKNSRNYYTHYNEKLKNKSLAGSELFYLSERMKIFLVCLILEQIGFSEDEITEAISEKGGFLFNHVIDWKELR